jgi:hypothetical protein
MNGLIVDVGVRLWEKFDKAVLQPKFDGGRACVLGAALGVQIPHGCDHLRHGYALRTGRPHQNVVDIDKR